MTIVPRYQFLPGTEVTLVERPLVVNGSCTEGYKVTGLDDGITTVVPYATFAEYMKLPGARIDSELPATGGRVRNRLGGFTSAEALTEEQRELGRFHFALCQGAIAYRAKLRMERDDPELWLSERMLDQPVAQKFIAQYATTMLGKPVRAAKTRGGKQTGLAVYKGRTLKKYLEILEGLAPGESPLDALVPLDHLKGNCGDRICQVLREIMTDVWEKIGLDLKRPAIANVRKELEAMISLKNAERARNGLPQLILPADRTLREHRDRLLTPTEISVATMGERHTRNKRGRGSTDLRALMVGEVVQVDECKMSLVMSAKKAGAWERLSDDEKAALEELEEYIRTRFWIVVMLDVASRMPLAWVISETPNAEATLALFRMATRDKTREKHMFGCTGEPAAAVGLMHVKNDNGPGLRNQTTTSALLGIGSANTVTRAYASTDRPHVERLFGTLEMDVFKLLPGYTGRRAGELPGYDATKNGVLSVDQLYGIVSRYFIDEYPSTRHYGTGMNGRQPFEVYKSLNETRGQIPPIDPHVRRIHLGWQQEVTPSDEGVCVFRGIWFNSEDLQLKREEYRVTGKVKVFVDPDNLNLATVILPNVPDPVEVQLQITAFADMSLPEVLNLMAEQRKQDPRVTELHHDKVMRTRLDRRTQINAIVVENNLPRSYSTIEECEAKGKVVFAGARMMRPAPLPATTPPGDLCKAEPAGKVYRLGEQDAPSDDMAEETLPAGSSDIGADRANEVEPGGNADAPSESGPRKPTRKRPTPSRPSSTPKKLSRPTNLKDLQ